MKLKFLLTLLFLCTLSYAQKKPREEAILPECKNMEYPATCSNKKIAEDLEKLLTKEIASDQIKENRKYFTLSLIFIVDTDGKVIPSETKATCEVILIRDATLAYVTSLPIFIPKDENQEERRDLFFNTITFVLNDDNSGYHTARPEEYKDKQIIQQKLEPDTYPVFPGCEDINDKDSKCISRNLNKYVIERYQIPKSFASGQVKMLVTFMVDEKGIISVMKVDGGPYDFQDEAKRVFSKLPKVKPASIGVYHFAHRLACLLRSIFDTRRSAQATFKRFIFNADFLLFFELITPLIYFESSMQTIWCICVQLFISTGILMLS